MQTCQLASVVQIRARQFAASARAQSTSQRFAPKHEAETQNIRNTLKMQIIECRIKNSVLQGPYGLIDEALVFGTKDCRFESCRCNLRHCFALHYICVTPCFSAAVLSLRARNQMTIVGFGPTPFRIGAMRERIKPLG